MPPTRRTRDEQALRQHFAPQGYGMVRSAGSHGALHLIAHDAAVVKWIQVKSTEAWEADNKSHSTGFSGRQMGSYVEGSSARDFPLIHDAWSPDYL
jgi:hypothetical protein